MIDIQKEKIPQAIVFFVKNTKKCGKTKLFKLLYFLDFIHFKKYGTTVTGLDYYAWVKGPVPKKLLDEFKIEETAKIYKDYFTIHKIVDEEEPERYSFKIIPKIKFNESLFTHNELEIMENVTFQFKDSTANEMSEITHLKNTPWFKTKEEYGLYSLINYFLALDKETELTKEDVEDRFTIEKELKSLT